MTPSATREVLLHMERFQGSTMFIAPSGIGPVETDDLEILLQDAELLAKLGMRIFLADREQEPFWNDLEIPRNLRRVSYENQSRLVITAHTHAATKLCLISGADHITTIAGRELDDVHLDEARRLLAEPALLTEESHDALRFAVSACEAGIPRVHIVNVHRDDALLDELFTDLGAGTMIYTGTRHKVVRPMVSDDWFSVCTLLYPAVPRRTIAFVEEHQQALRVFTVDDDVHGVARVLMRGDTLLVRNLAHSPRSRRNEVLEALLRAAMTEASERGATRVAVPVDEIPPLMRILPSFTGLGFTREQISTGMNQQEVWLLPLAAKKAV